MADLTRLKKGAASKGTPPTLEETNLNLSTPPREQPAKKTPIKKIKMEFSVPEGMVDEFAIEAGKRFGFKKGSKSDLFVAMWEEYLGSSGHSAG